MNHNLLPPESIATLLSLSLPLNHVTVFSTLIQPLKIQILSNKIIYDATKCPSPASNPGWLLNLDSQLTPEEIPKTNQLKNKTKHHHNWKSPNKHLTPSPILIVHQNCKNMHRNYTVKKLNRTPVLASPTFSPKLPPQVTPARHMTIWSTSACSALAREPKNTQQNEKAHFQ